MINKIITISGGSAPYYYNITGSIVDCGTVTAFYNNNQIPLEGNIGAQGVTNVQIELSIDCNECTQFKDLSVYSSWTTENNDICSQTLNIPIVCDQPGGGDGEQGSGGDCKTCFGFNGLYALEVLTLETIISGRKWREYTIRIMHLPSGNYISHDEYLNIFYNGSNALNEEFNLFLSFGLTQNFEPTNAIVFELFNDLDDSFKSSISTVADITEPELDYQSSNPSDTEFFISFKLPKEYLEEKNINNNISYSIFLSLKNTPTNLNSHFFTQNPCGFFFECANYNVLGTRYTNFCGICHENEITVDCNKTFVVQAGCGGIVNLDLPECIDELRVEAISDTVANKILLEINDQIVAESPWWGLGGYPTYVNQLFASIDAGSFNGILNPDFIYLNCNWPTDSNIIINTQLFGQNPYFGDDGWEVYVPDGLTVYNIYDGNNPITFEEVLYNRPIPTNPNLDDGNFTANALTLVWTNDNNTPIESARLIIPTETNDCTCMRFHVRCPQEIPCNFCDFDIDIPNITVCSLENVNNTVTVSPVNTIDPLIIEVNGSEIYNNIPGSTIVDHSFTVNMLEGSNSISVTQGDCTETRSFFVTLVYLHIELSVIEEICDSYQFFNFIIENWNPNYSYSYNIDGGPEIAITNNPVSVENTFLAGDTFTLTVNVTDPITNCSDQISASYTVIDCENPISLACLGPDSIVLDPCPSEAEALAEWTTWSAQFQYDGSADDACDITQTTTEIYVNGTLIPGAIDSSYIPPLCGGSTTVEYVYSGCNAGSVSCEATFTIPLNNNITATCPVDETYQSSDFANQGELDLQFSNWANSFQIGLQGCYATHPIPEYELTETWTVGTSVYTNVTDLINSHTPTLLGGSVTVDYAVTDPCGNSASCSSTFTVELELQPLSISCDNATIECPGDGDPLQAADIQSAYNNFLNSANASGGVPPLTVTHDGSPTAPPVNTPTTVTFTVTDGNNDTQDCAAVFEAIEIPSTQVEFRISLPRIISSNSQCLIRAGTFVTSTCQCPSSSSCGGDIEFKYRLYLWDPTLNGGLGGFPITPEIDDSGLGAGNSTCPLSTSANRLIGFNDPGQPNLYCSNIGLPYRLEVYDTINTTSCDASFLFTENWYDTSANISDAVTSITYDLNGFPTIEGTLLNESGSCCP